MQIYHKEMILEIIAIIEQEAETLQGIIRDEMGASRDHLEEAVQSLEAALVSRRLEEALEHLQTALTQLRAA